ncbi:50S ribosomal protein L4 [Candidatus Shapirobacteria bacterium]|nr:50S ribosomal protein L4 [Candidatus Shapirobacteria bacterium]
MSLSVDLYNYQGERQGKKIRLSEELFGQEANKVLLAQAVRVYLANQRCAFPKAKTRAEVDGSGRKIYSQKGTGRARHGDRQAPIFVGGGKAHGPRGAKIRLSLPKKMRKKALAAALSEKAGKGEIKLVADIQKMPPKTKMAEELLKKINLAAKKIGLVMTGEEKEKVGRAFRNLATVAVFSPNTLNPYLILEREALVFTPQSLAVLAGKEGEEKGAAKESQEVRNGASNAKIKSQSASWRTK